MSGNRAIVVANKNLKLFEKLYKNYLTTIYNGDIIKTIKGVINPKQRRYHYEESCIHRYDSGAKTGHH